MTFLEVYCARAIAANRADSQDDRQLLAKISVSGHRGSILRYLVSLLSEDDFHRLRENTPFSGPLASVSPRIQPGISTLGWVVREVPRATRAAKSVTEPVAEADEDRKNILVFPVHGFNSRGDWKHKLGLPLTSSLSDLGRKDF